LRIVIPTTGSRGDIQPYVALGLGLRARGHQVCIATHADFEPFVRRRGLDFFAIETGGGRAMQTSEVGERMVNVGAKAFRFLREYARLRLPLMHELMQRCWQACRGADVVFLTNMEFFPAHAAAEKLGLPTCWLSLQPMSPSWYVANCLFPPRAAWLRGGGLYNLATHLAAAVATWQSLRPAVNRARADVLGLPPLPFWGPAWEYLFPPPRLEGYSPHIVLPPPDWGADHHVTGYWFLDEPGWAPPAELTAFLAAGPAPVYIGFGSTHNRDREEVGALVFKALARAGQRGVLMSGWGGLPEALHSGRVLSIRGAPHDWLFQRMAAAVHHGGAGTTVAGLRAGVPSLVVPYNFDQYFWARRVHELGAGPRPIPRKRLTAERLARALGAAVSDPRVRERAARHGECIRSEDGVGRAVELFEAYADGARLRRFAPPRNRIRRWVSRTLARGLGPRPAPHLSRASPGRGRLCRTCRPLRG
jgi:UDP:flavonoid glycosyltransferase YjiC (YdhE family)